MSPGRISSYLFDLNRAVVSYWPRCEYTRYWLTLFILDTSKHLGPSINGLVANRNTKICCRGFILELFQITTANKLDSEQYL